MSGAIKAIGKVFKAIVKSPIFKVIAIAAAVYFTGGLALGAMGSAFAASLPGIAGAADLVGLGTTGAFATVGLDATTAALAAGDLATGAATYGEGALSGTSVMADLGSTADAGAGAAATDIAAPVADASAGAATGDTAAIDAANSAPALDSSGAPLQTGTTDLAANSPVTDPSAPTPGTPNVDPNAGMNANAGTPNAPSAPGSPTAPTATPSNPTTAPAATTQPAPGSTPGGDKPGTMQAVSDWIKTNPGMAMILGQSVASLGSSAVNAISTNATQSQQQAQYNQNRADAIARGTVPNETGSATWKPQAYKTPGVIDAALNAKPTGG